MLTPEARRCSECGTVLKSYQARFCGHACRGKVRARENAANAKPRVCVVCSVALDVSVPSNRHRVTCSTACDRERRRGVARSNVAAGKGPPRNVMTEAQREEARQRITGQNAPWWNGGRSRTDGGYIMAVAPADYPFPESVGAGGRIREHRMVMELHLGRALRPEEVVHHRNEIRDDNRLENLELKASHAEHMKEHAPANTERLLRAASAVRYVPTTCRTCGCEFRTNARGTGECVRCRSVRYEAKRRERRRAA